MQIRRGAGGRFYEVASKIIEGEPEERKIATSWRLREPIIVSLDSLSKVLGTTKSEILNEVLEAGLTELCAVLRETRPELSEIRDEPYEVTSYLTPEEARQAKRNLGGGLEFQLDLEDCIADAENNQDKTEETE